MKRIPYFLLILSLVLGSCHSHSDTGEIGLNNGEKWQVNTEMMPPIEASKSLVLEFAGENLEDYQKLGANLNEKIQDLISSCTMKGKGHDELHKWLHPYMKLVEELSKASETSEAKLVVAKIENSFTTFNRYFQ